MFSSRKQGNKYVQNILLAPLGYNKLGVRNTFNILIVCNKTN